MIIFVNLHHFPAEGRIELSKYEKSRPVSVGHRFLPVLSFWPYSILTRYLANQAQKLRKILSILKIFLSWSGKEPYKLKGYQ